MNSDDGHLKMARNGWTGNKTMGPLTCDVMMTSRGILIGQLHPVLASDWLDFLSTHP